MDQHPIPRQITTFEFKLIGFMTLKQFLYLVIFAPLGYIVFFLVPIPIVNIVVGAAVGAIGLVLAFVPIQDRPIDIWIRNLVKRLTSPTQYMYQKNNQALYFLKDLYFLHDPHKVLSHIDSQEKLAAYLAQRRQQSPVNAKQKQHIQSLLRENPTSVMQKTETIQPSATIQPSVSSGVPFQTTVVADSHSSAAPVPMNIPVSNKRPFFIGTVRNNKQTPLPDMLVYVKDRQNNPLRLLKTNPHGVFATYSPLPVGDYLVEIKDPTGHFFFDTMNIHVEQENPVPFEFYSKELL